MKTIIYLIAAMFVCGCSTYRKYERPPINVAESYRNISGNDTATIAVIPWRQMFCDNKLQQLIDTALVNNTDLNVARWKVIEAEALLKSAKLAYLPSLNALIEGGLSHYAGTNAETYSLNLSANWELDVFGKLTNAKRNAAEAYRASKDYQQAVITQLIATLADSYYTLCLLDSKYRINENTLANWKETVRALEVMKKGGKTNDAAILQAKANLMALETTLISIAKGITDSENAISVLIGHSCSKIERGDLNGFNVPDEINVGIPIQLLSNRPDVRQAERQLAQAFYATNIARAAFYPTLSLSGTIGWTNNGGIVTNPGQWLLNAIGSLTQPIFNRGNNIANLRIAEAQQEEAKLLFQQALLDAGKEVNDALSQVQSARNQNGIVHLQIDTLNEAVRKTKLLMKYSSSTSYLEVLTAQQSLLDAELSLLQCQFDEIQGFIKLYHSLGGGLDT